MARTINLFGTRNQYLHFTWYLSSCLEILMGVPLAVGSSLRYGNDALARRTLLFQPGFEPRCLRSHTEPSKTRAYNGGLGISLIRRGSATG